MRPEKNNTFCSLPFKQIAMKSFDLDYIPCCNVLCGKYIPIAPKELSPEEAFDSKMAKQLRRDLLNNIKNPVCKICWDQEDRNLTSYRMYYGDHDPEPALTTIDISLSNHCNLRCRMCDTGSSHSLLIDKKAMEKNGTLDQFIQISGKNFRLDSAHKISSPQYNWFMNNTHKINHIKASGGEPFFDRQIIKLLEKYVETDDAKNTILEFHTNGTQFTKKIVELNSKFKSLEHTISVDGTDYTYEYIRFGKFSKLEDSIDMYLRYCDNIEVIHITVVVQAFNIFDIRNIIEWAGLTFNKHKYYVGIAQIHPYNRGSSLRSLPISMLQDIDDCGQFQLREILNDAIANNNENKQKLKTEAVILDNVRNQSYTKLNKKLVDWLDS